MSWTRCSACASARAPRRGLTEPLQRLAAKHDVGVPVGEAQRAIQPDGRGVGLVDVEHDLGQAAAAQVAQARERECAAETSAALGWIDADYVDLADRLMPVVASVVGLPAAMDLRPVKAGQPPVPFGEEEAVRIEPRLALAHV